MIFILDFENVNNSGFDGIEELSAEDRVIIFYSENADSISLGVHRKLEVSQVQKEYCPIKIGGKNALDFQLSSYLGYLIAKNPDEEYCIVSKDEGYRFVSEFWEQRKINVLRCANLRRETSKSLSNDLKKILPDYKSEAEDISKIIMKYKTKQGVNNALMRKYGSAKTGIIYKSLKAMLKDKK